MIGIAPEALARLRLPATRYGFWIGAMAVTCLLLPIFVLTRMFY